LESPPAPTELAGCRSIIYTPSVTITPRRLTTDLHELNMALKLAVDAALYPDRERFVALERLPDRTELVLVDEADRLKLLAIEQLRDHYDREGFGLVLIGMPGLEKRLARYPQLASRVGFVHQYRALSTEELAFILTHNWAEFGLTFAPDDFPDAEALAAIARITGGNFRLVQRLCTQIERLVEINQLRSISKAVVEAARESLVIGPAG
jgi:DNA transposition AAA+ family ATPase